MIGTVSLQEVQKKTGGVLSGDASFSAVSIDTRTLQPGDLFVALKGPNFNGNEFVARATEQKASAVVVSEDVETTLPMLKVDDTRKALGLIGNLNRSLASACVIALTGSQGKTSVKEMTASILGECGNVMMTQGNLNNDLGVPLSLSRIVEDNDFSVIEMGANGPGEIAYMVGLAQPRIGHITCIAGTHLEGFGDLDGVARAKGEIWQGIEEDGIAIVNLDDAYAPQFIEQINQQAGNRTVVTVSGHGKPDADYRASNIEMKALEGIRFVLESQRGNAEISLTVPGHHNVSNALAAAAMAMSAGAELQHIKAGLEKYTPVKGRMCMVKGVSGSTVIDDTYNASPSSFRAAIDVLTNSSGKTIVVMGDMAELGAEEESSHREVGAYAREQGVEVFIAVGELSRMAVQAYGEGGVFLENRDGFLTLIAPLLDESTTVLVKGSRSQSMEELVAQIKEEIE